MRIGYAIDTWTNVDFQEISKMEAGWLKIMKPLFIEKILKRHRLKIIEKLLAFR